MDKVNRKTTAKNISIMNYKPIHSFLDSFNIFSCNIPRIAIENTLIVQDNASTYCTSFHASW